MATATLLTREYAVRVYGTPAPKGSMKCVGQRGPRRHVLVEDNTRTEPWRARVRAAGLRLRILQPITGPIGVDLTITVALPDSIRPERRTWPHTQSAHDVDKLARCILDGLQDAHVFANDAQVVELTIRKVYPHTPGQPDALTRPGATIRLYPIGA